MKQLSFEETATKCVIQMDSLGNRRGRGGIKLRHACMHASSYFSIYKFEIIFHEIYYNRHKNFVDTFKGLATVTRQQKLKKQYTDH